MLRYFRNRIIFPIKNNTGNIIGFAGREIENKQPKYLNTPNGLLYNKSKVLYNIDKAQIAIREKEEVIITEGYTDAIRLHSVGKENVVALGGTSFTNEQVLFLRRLTQKAILIFDSDENKSGQNALRKSARALMKNNFDVFTYRGIGTGEDPDSYFAANTYDAGNVIPYLMYEIEIAQIDAHNPSRSKETLGFLASL